MTGVQTCALPISTDSAGNTVIDNNSGSYYTFTTLADTAFPEITFDSEEDILSLDYDSVTLRWFTNEACVSRLDYGTSTSYGTIKEEGTYNFKHSFSLSDLSPSTTYHFKFACTDNDGNTTIDTNSGDGYAFITEKENICEECQDITTLEEAEEIFEDLPEDDFVDTVIEMIGRTVLAPKILGTEPKVKVTSTAAKIIWTTDKNSNSIVAIVKSKDYDSARAEPYFQIVGNSEEQVKIHAVNITGLSPSTRYHFELRSKSSIGPVGKSKDFIFKTKSLMPKMFEEKVYRAGEFSAILSWKTNLPCSSNLKYTNLKTKKSLIQGEPILRRDHFFTLKNLKGGVDYKVIIAATDERGNKIESKPLFFSTEKDNSPPKISQVTADSALYSGKKEKVQTIVSWVTDESATSQLFWQEGIGKKLKVFSLPKDDVLTTEHFIVITTFKPGSVYKFYVESEDLAGNKSRSKDFTTLIPIEKESAFQLITKNFEEIFSWTKSLGF